MPETEEYQKLHDTWRKCLTLAKDKAATAGERDSAQNRANVIQEKLSKLEDNRYRGYVQRGQEAMKKLDTGMWEIGELASKIASNAEYGEAKLEQFAANIDMNYGTLKQCHATYKAWKEKVGRPTFSFWTAYVLNTHPEKEKIAKENPKLTFREAQTKIAEYKAKKQQAKKKRKANGQDKEEKKRAQKSTSQVPSLIGMIESMLDDGGVVQRAFLEMEFSKEERKQVVDALDDLRLRVVKSISQMKGN